FASHRAHIGWAHGLCAAACRRHRVPAEPGDPAALLVDGHHYRMIRRLANAFDPIEDRQIGPAADENTADLFVCDHVDGVIGVFDAHHEQLGQPFTLVEAVEELLAA